MWLLLKEQKLVKEFWNLNLVAKLGENKILPSSIIISNEYLKMVLEYLEAEFGVGEDEILR